MKKKEKKCHILYKYGPANVLSLNVLLNFGPAHLVAARRDFIIVLLDFGPAPLLDGGGKLRRTNYFRWLV